MEKLLKILLFLKLESLRRIVIDFKAKLKIRDAFFLLALKIEKP